ncbi:MAG: signal peptide peptidase SppA [Cyclobacteriaceae bacterium]|nr:signal peptide peptidase SppA [Cyclobacteriaceae bacterium HetDA_MAG_MS6]
MAFLRNLLATIVGLFVFSLFLFVIFVGIVSATSSEEKPVVQDNSVLYLKLSGIIRERVVEDPLQELFPSSGPRVIGLNKLLSAIQEAAVDDKVRGIYMEHQFITGGFASLQEIRNALMSFKKTGKFIYSYGEYISEKDYFLASVADEIYLNPQGSLEFNGLSANVTFWKGLFDKLEIEPEIFRVGTFKSYVEPYQQKKMSDENRLQIRSLLSSLYDTYLQQVADARKIEIKKLRSISDQLKVQVPTDAAEYGLVNKVAYEDEIKSKIMQQVGEDDVDDVNFISYSRYAASLDSDYSKNKIAVIVANGDIVMAGDEDAIVGEKFAREIRKARENDRIKAIVLRVNSPGGSITASDMIWREVQLTKGVKPIVASMSDVAASGGYYISMLCDTIVAQPNTVTGSIGIFSILFNLENFLESKLGITHDVVNTGQYSDILTVTRPLTDFERSVYQRGVEKGYDTFITKASKARGVSTDDIDQVGGGRVWSGEQALENGLIDVLGGIDDAIAIAAQSAGIEDDYQARFYPEQKPLLEELLGKLSDEVEARVFADVKSLPLSREIEFLKQMQGLQVRMSHQIEIN